MSDRGGSRRRWAALAAVGVTLSAAGVAYATAGTAVAEAVTPAAAPAAPVSITLITGDTVTVSAHGTAVDRAPGRSGIHFVRQNTGGDQYVIPADAVPLLRTGKLDRRLFDVTLLRKFGYTGGRDLPLIVQYPKAGANKVRAAVTGKAEVSRDLTKIGMMAMHTSRSAQARLWTSLTNGTASARTLRSGVEKVFLDGQLQLADDVSDAQVGAPAAWQQGLDGTGVTVAVLDSGIDATHPDLAGKIAETANFTDAPSMDDTSGHGTHVASIIAGSGAESGGKYKGVAPGAKLAIGKVCTTGCDESALLAGMQWAAPLAPVINISLNGYRLLDPDPIDPAIQALTEADGTLFVIASGNQGYQGTDSVQFPGDISDALTVGAVDANDQVAYFSGRGPTGPDELIKPDLTAPGVGIVAARAANGTIGTPVADGYVSASGTSMATPHVAGAAAILAEEHPGWSPRQRKTVLMGAAQPTAGTSVFDQGAGRLDVARAVGQDVSVDEGSVSFGKQEWPHADDVPITKTITYRNGGGAPVTLALAVQGDTDTFSVAASSLTVPAGGTATTTVTADTSGAGTDGLKSGWVVATGAGDLRVETPLGVDRGIETHDVTISHLGRDGQPSNNYYTALIGLNGEGTYEYYQGEDAETVTVPKGTYGLVATIYESDGTADMLVEPSVAVDDAQTITLDARQAKPVTITPPRSDAKQAAAEVTANWTTSGGGTAGWSVDSTTPGDLYTAQVGPAAARDGFQAEVGSVFAKWKNDDEGFADSPWTYETKDVRPGTFYTGFDKRIVASELAAVKQRFAREADGATGLAYNWPVVGGDQDYTIGLPFSLPFERTAYLSVGTGWLSEFDQQTFTRSTRPVQQFEAGHVYRQDWNKAVFAPSGDTAVVTRDGDKITAAVPLFTDGTGQAVDSSTDTARTALYANGTLVTDLDAGEGTFAVPAAATDYRLEMSATRSAPFRLSTSVSGVWTFSSKNGDTQLSLPSVRFTPRLDAGNTAPKGAFGVPVDAGAGTLTGAYSTDDGKTWQLAGVTGSGNRRVLQVTNPASGYVSLRATTTDGSGATGTVTVLRAYAIS